MTSHTPRDTFTHRIDGCGYNNLKFLPLFSGSTIDRTKSFSEMFYELITLLEQVIVLLYCLLLFLVLNLFQIFMLLYGIIVFWHLLFALFNTVFAQIE